MPTTIELPHGLTSAIATIDGTGVTYDRLLSPAIVPGDVTVTIDGVTTEATNLPSVDSDGGVTLELTDAESVNGAVVTFDDLDKQWLRVTVTLIGDTTSTAPDSALTQSISDRLDRLTDRLIHAHVTLLGPPIVGDTLRLVRNKDYTASNGNLISITLPAVAGRGTADEALLTVTDCWTGEPALLRAQGVISDDAAVWSVPGDQLGFPASSKYRFMVELRHGEEYQAVLIGKAVLLQDIAAG